MAEIRKNSSNWIFICVVAALQTNFALSKLSDYATICSAKDPNLNECFKKSALEMLGKMSNGIPEFGLPPLDPLHISNAYLEQPDIGLVLTITNTTVYNLGKAMITDVSVQPKNFRLKVVLLTKKLTIIGNYKIKGKVFIMPIHGKGLINTTLTDVNTLIQVTGKPEVRNGELYMVLQNVSVSLDPKKVKLHLDNLFNGNEMLGTIMNNVLNNNWQELYVFLRPKLEGIWENELFHQFSEFLSRIPYNEMFHDMEIQS